VSRGDQDGWSSSATWRRRRCFAALRLRQEAKDVLARQSIYLPLGSNPRRGARLELRSRTRPYGSLQLASQPSAASRYEYTMRCTIQAFNYPIARPNSDRCHPWCGLNRLKGCLSGRPPSSTCILCASQSIGHVLHPVTAGDHQMKGAAHLAHVCMYAYLMQPILKLLASCTSSAACAANPRHGVGSVAELGAIPTTYLTNARCAYIQDVGTFPYLL
jgi:hypothetical protein